MWSLPSASRTDPNDRVPELVSGTPSPENRSPHGPERVASAVSRPEVTQRADPSSSTLTSVGLGVRSKATDGALVGTKWLARTDTTSGAGEESSTVMVGVLRWDPRCSTGRVSTATEPPAAVV